MGERDEMSPLIWWEAWILSDNHTQVQSIRTNHSIVKVLENSGFDS